MSGIHRRILIPGIRSMNRFSLKLKLLTLSCFVMIMVCAVLGFSFFYQIKMIMLENFIKQGIMLTKNLAHNSRYGVFTEDRAILDELVLGVIQVEEVVNVTILNSEGKILVQKNILGTTIHNPDGLDHSIQWKKAVESGNPVKELVTSKDGEEFYFIYVPVTSSWIRSGSVPEWLLEESTITKSKETGLIKLGVVQVVLSASPLSQRINNVLLIVVGLTFLSMAGGVCLIYYIFRKAYIKPLENLARVAQRVAGGDLSQTVSHAGQDEIGTLTDSFNCMMNSLKHRDEQSNEYIIKLENLNKELMYINYSLEEQVREKTRERVNYGADESNGTNEKG